MPDLRVLVSADGLGRRLQKTTSDPGPRTGWIDLHLQRIRIVETRHGQAPLDVLLGAGRFDPTQLPAHAEPAPSHHRPNGDEAASFERWSYRTAEPFSADALQRMIKRDLPASVYRCKGIIHITGSDRPHALQVVGRRLDLSPWNGDFDGSEIVAIGRHVDSRQLDELFAGCERAE